MNRFTAILRRIWRTIKMYQVAILMGLVGICLPVGAGFWIVGLQEDTTKLATIFMVLGFIFWLVGIYAWYELKKVVVREDNIEKAKYAVQLAELKSIRTDISKSINGLADEIRKDREQRIKGGGGDGM